MVVATLEKRKRVDGKLVPTTVKKYATAHDLRRSFGTRWAKRVMPAVLQRLMRHAEIATTMKYYVTMDADCVADEVVGARIGEPAGNSFGNNRPQQAQKAETAPADESTETIEQSFSYVSGGHGARTRNPFRGTTFPVWPLAIRLPSRRICK